MVLRYEGAKTYYQVACGGGWCDSISNFGDRSTINHFDIHRDNTNLKLNDTII